MKQYIVITKLNSYESLLEEFETEKEAAKAYWEAIKIATKGEIITIAKITSQSEIK